MKKEKSEEKNIEQGIRLVLLAEIARRKSEEFLEGLQVETKNKVFERIEQKRREKEGNNNKK